MQVLFGAVAPAVVHASVVFPASFAAAQVVGVAQFAFVQQVSSQRLAAHTPERHSSFPEHAVPGSFRPSVARPTELPGMQ